MNRFLLVLLLLSMASCQNERVLAPSPTPALLPTITATIPAITTSLPSPTASPSPSPTRLPSPTVLPSPSPAPAASQLCSPLEDFTFGDLKKIVTTPFDAPLPGLDNGHFGIDLSYYRWGERETMLGLPIYSILPGKVASVVQDRYPYGNMVIIETSLSSLSPDLRSLLDFPIQPTPVPGSIRLTCPALDPQPAWDLDNRSLYVLYAHMNKSPLVASGEKIACGQTLGEVGTSGGSINPHLHLETRLGPSGAAFSSMSHYRNSATDQEKASYCTWRVSGLFQAFDPQKLLFPNP